MIDWRASRQGERAVSWINNLTHIGDAYGEPFNLRLWQEDYIRQLFGTVDADGTRTIRKSFLFLPRGQGKTEICAAIGVYCLLGTGKCGQEIYSAASNREQAARIFKAMATMIEADEYLNSQCVIYHSYKRIVVPSKDNIYVAMSKVSASGHGLAPDVVLFDELHTQTDRRLFDALVTGFAKKKEPLLVMISTAGDDRHSLCHDEWEYACKVRDGVVDNPNYLPVLYAADPSDDWESEETWYKAMPALGDFCHVQSIKDDYLKAKDLPAEEARFKQLYLNLWQQPKNKLIPQEKWDAGKGPALIEPGSTIYGGIDLSTIWDITAFVIVYVDEEFRYHVMPYFWMPKENAVKKARLDQVPYLQWAQQGLVNLTEGDVIDYRQVRKDINSIIAEYDVKRLFIDPANATQLALQLRDEDGWPIEQFRQSMLSVNAPTKELLRLIMSGQLVHGGNPVLTWMADNCTAITDSNDNIRINKEKSRNRIDGISALVCAIAAAMTDFAPQIDADPQIKWV